MKKSLIIIIISIIVIFGIWMLWVWVTLSNDAESNNNETLQINTNIVTEIKNTNNELIIKCKTDDDCVVGGCSSQLCALATEVNNLVTTCEYREEYSCLSQTTCGCFKGQCGWQQTDEYQSCLNALK